MEFLSQKGVPYEDRDITTNEDWLNELVATGYMATPVTKVGEQTVVGFDPPRLEKALRAAGAA